MMHFQETDVSSAPFDEDTAAHIDGHALCNALIGFLENRYRGRIRTSILGAADGRYLVPTLSTAQLLRHILRTVGDTTALEVQLRADSYAMYVTVHTPRVSLGAQTRRHLLLEAQDRQLELSIEPEAFVLRFPACESTFALRHPSARSAKERLVAHLSHAWEAIKDEGILRP